MGEKKLYEPRQPPHQFEKNGRSILLLMVLSFSFLFSLLTDADGCPLIHAPFSCSFVYFFLSVFFLFLVSSFRLSVSEF